MKKVLVRSKKYGNKYALVDDEDYERVNNFCTGWYLLVCKRNKYAQGRIKGNYKKEILMHTVIMGANPIGRCIDHKNRNGLDNRKVNLHFVTLSENGRNRRKRIGASSKYLGVFFRKDNKKWSAKTRLNNILINIGTFNTELEAHKAYQNYWKLLY